MVYGSFSEGPAGKPAQENPIARAALEQWERQAERESVRRSTLRLSIGAVDYDIAERRSWSSAFKAHVQAQRAVAKFDADRERHSIWQRLHRAIWGEP